MAARQNTVNCVSQRRKAIYKGLSQYLTGDDLLNAMCIWQQEYSQLPKFAITNFVRRITEHTGLANERAAIHLSLTSSLMLGEDNLGTDPLPDMRHYLGKRVGAAEAETIMGRSNGVPVTAETGAAPDSTLVFELLLNDFLRRIAISDPGAARQVRNSLLHSLPDMHMFPGCRQPCRYGWEGKASN
jgi:hypothetical protein